MIRNAYSSNLHSIRIYIIIALIFSIIMAFAWAVLFGYYFVYDFLYFGVVKANPYHFAPSGIFGIVCFALMGSSILVARNANKMRNAADSEDIHSLLELSSMDWAITALLLAGVIPGIMLLAARGPAKGLRVGGRTMSSFDSYQDIRSSYENLDRILKLKTVLDSGAITKEEFEQKKNGILNPEGPAYHSLLEADLKRLKSLYQSGALSRSEYDEQRRKLLSQL